MWRFLCFLLVLCSCGAQGEETEKCKLNRSNEEKRLRKDLFKGTFTTTSPVNDYNRKMNVTMQLMASRISFDPDSGYGDMGYIIMDMKYHMLWNAPCTTWDPSKYGSLDILNSVYYDIWTPEFVTEHELVDDNSMMYNMLSDVCSISNKGDVRCTCIDYIQFPCKVASMRLWPFETNKCELKMIPDPATKQAVNLNIELYNNSHTFQEVLSSGDWIITSVKTKMYKPLKNINSLDKLRNDNNGFILEINLKRNYQLISSYVVYPLIVIMILTISSLSLHIGSITKVLVATVSLGYHFKITTLVTIELPQSVSDAPLIVTFIRDSTVLTSVVLLSSLLTYYMYRRVETHGRWTIAIDNIFNNTKVGLFVFYDVPSRFKGIIRKADGSIEQVSETQANNNVIWHHIACIINSITIVVIGFCYFVYMCMFLAFFVEINI